MWRIHVTYDAQDILVLPHDTHEWVTSHTRTSHVTHMNESRHTQERVMWHIWMSHVTHKNESCHTHGWVTSHTRTSHVTPTNASRHTHECAMSHIWKSHVTHMNERVMSQVLFVATDFKYIRDIVQEVLGEQMRQTAVETSPNLARSCGADRMQPCRFFFHLNQTLNPFLRTKLETTANLARSCGVHRIQPCRMFFFPIPNPKPDP